MTLPIHPSVSAIIPTYNAEPYLDKLLAQLHNQSIKLSEIIIIDSQSSDQTESIARRWNTRFFSIAKSDFDHGGTRNWAVKNSSSDYILFLTQDALPADDHLVENLYTVLAADPSVAVSFAKQIPYETASPVEKFTRHFNYPDNSWIRSIHDVDKYGIKTFFLSDVCALYSRAIFDEMGGFTSPILTNEDMMMASSLLRRGYKTAYQASAIVYHSHNYTLKQQYKRNFDIGVFLAMHHDKFPVKDEVGEGLKMVKAGVCYFLSRFRLISLFQLLLSSFVKYLGNRAGHHYQDYSLREKLKRTNYPMFWNRFYEEYGKQEKSHS